MSAERLNPALPLQQDQRLQLEQVEHQQRLRQLERAAEPAPVANASPTPQTSSHCWPVSGIRLAGNRLLSQQTLATALQPQLQPCMSEAQINQLLKTITQLYLDQGYLASRPYLANAPQAGASLDILIVEGFVESIELADPSLPLSLSNAFPGLIGHPLTLTELEQGLDQLNRLQAFNLTADVEPGTLQGGTRVIIHSQHSAARWKLGSTYDNLGGELTGRNRVGVSLSVDSPLELNDFIRLSANGTLQQGAGYSRGYGLYYNIPYGPWTFGLNLNQLEYLAPLPGSRVVSSGHSEFYSLSLERSLWRNRQGLLSTSLRLSQKRLENSLAGQRLQLQSPTLTSLEAGLNFLWLEDGLWSGYLGVTQGLDWFGADRQQLRANTPQPLFRKYRASLLHLRQSQDPTLRWRWESELNLQYSPAPLPAVEQQLLSDDSAVRGFRQAVVSGASGAVWRNTLSLPLDLSQPDALEIRPHLGVDLGWSKFDHGQPLQRLVGAHGGVRLSLPVGYLKLDYQRALQASNVRRRALESGYWLLELALNI